MYIGARAIQLVGGLGHWESLFYTFICGVCIQSAAPTRHGILGIVYTISNKSIRSWRVVLTSNWFAWFVDERDLCASLDVGIAAGRITEKFFFLLSLPLELGGGVPLPPSSVCRRENRK